MAQASSSRSPRERGGKDCTKPPLTLEALVERLSKRGIHVPDKDRAERYVRHIGYYRLSPYIIPFRQSRSRDVQPGTSFDQILDLYMFDRSLRMLVTDALERVEVAVRAALTDHMSTAHNDPHWYVDSRHFVCTETHTDLLSSLRGSINAQLKRPPETKTNTGLHHRSALEHYLTTYGSPELPPSWLMVEMLTLGQLVRIYRNLRNPDDRKRIARTLGLQAPVLDSWLRVYQRIRNICAHHGRLWNTGLGVHPVLPKSKTIPWLTQEIPPDKRQRLYPVLASFHVILRTVSPHSTWASSLHELITHRPEMYRRGMGVLEDWSDDPFWGLRTK